MHKEIWTIGRILQWTEQYFQSKEMDTPRLDGEVLLSHILGKDRIYLYTHYDQPLIQEELDAFRPLVQERAKGHCVAAIIGKKDFMGLTFKVNDKVLIPRPDTETLVEKALDFLKDKTSARVLDMGTGSGAIALSIAHFAPQAQVFASDISQEALAIAQVNAEKFKLNVDFRQSSWFDQFCGETFHLIVSNPPYIHKDDHHLQQGDLRFEPMNALTDYDDGLRCYREIIQQAPQYLARGGALYLEHGWDQAASVRELLRQAGFSEVQSIRDLAGIERVSGGVLLTE